MSRKPILIVKSTKFDAGDKEYAVNAHLTNGIAIHFLRPQTIFYSLPYIEELNKEFKIKFKLNK